MNYSLEIERLVAHKHKLEAEIERLLVYYNLMRSAVAWADSHEVERKLGHTPQWLTMAREAIGAPVQQPPCKRCGGKGEYTVEITNHGERNEFFQEVQDGWFKLSGDSRLGRCATEECGGQPTERLEVGGVGANYCSGCRANIESQRRAGPKSQDKEI